MESPELKKASRLDSPAFVEEIRKKFAVQLDKLGQRVRLPEDTAERVICGEKIKPNFSISETLLDVSREFHLSVGEIDKLRELFFEE